MPTPSLETSVAPETMRRLLLEEHAAQLEAEMSAHDERAAVASREDASAAAAMETAAAPETLGEAASRLPFSKSLNATLMEALGAVVDDARAAGGGEATSDPEALRESGSETFEREARTRASARAATAAAEIAAARAEAEASARGAVDARANDERHETSSSGTVPSASGATASMSPDRLNFKERLKMFNARAS
jgi:hypothetical protein